MRVISGKLKGRLLLSPQENNIRPTADRIKETLFNILYSMGFPEDKIVLDLFCGSGALGIECLSRDAKKVVFADKSSYSVRLTKQNLLSLKVDDSLFEIYNTEYKLVLKKLKGTKFDLVILDPPYNLHIEQHLIELILKYELLKTNSVIVIEHSSDNILSFDEQEFDIDVRNLKNTYYTFLTKK